MSACGKTSACQASAGGSFVPLITHFPTDQQLHIDRYLGMRSSVAAAGSPPVSTHPAHEPSSATANSRQGPPERADIGYTASYISRVPTPWCRQTITILGPFSGFPNTAVVPPSSERTAVHIGRYLHHPCDEPICAQHSWIYDTFTR